MTRSGAQCKNRCNPDSSSGVCHVHASPCRKLRDGRLYVLSNPRIKGLKIGYTTGRASDRAAALSTTGVPIPFVVEYETDVVPAAEACEGRVFDALAACRVAASREFFDTSVDNAKRAIAAATAAPTLRADPQLVDVDDGVDQVTLRFGDTLSVTVKRPLCANAQNDSS